VADTEIHTGFLDHLASRGYRWSNKHCAWCGKYWEPLDYRGLFPRCEGCSDDRTHKRRALFLATERKEPPEVRFAGLFEAARVLLEDGAYEDRVFPTLAYAGLEVRDSGGKWSELRASLAEASGNPEQWERLSKFARAEIGVEPKTLIRAWFDPILSEIEAVEDTLSMAEMDPQNLEEYESTLRQSWRKLVS
jgi:hypothetical protein